jgi:hypothetical protein
MQSKHLKVLSTFGLSISLILIASLSYAESVDSPIKEPATSKAQKKEPATSKALTSIPPKAQWAFANQFAIRYNPLGLQNETFIGYKSKLYNKPHDNLLFGKAYWWAGGIARVSPQFAQTGVFFRTLPIAILELQGVFSRVTGFKDSSEIQGYYTDGTRDAVGNTSSARAATGNFIGSGWQASIQARLQIKIKSIAIRSTNLFRRFDLNGEGEQLDDDLFYDQTLDVITPFKSWVYQNDVDVLYVNKNNPWVLGARYTITKPLTDPTSPEVAADEMYDIQRAGFLFAWKFKAPPTAQGLEARRRHALIVLSQWHLDHSYRVGQSMNKLIPYFAVVYSLSGRVGSDR